MEDRFNNIIEFKIGFKYLGFFSIYVKKIMLDKC